MKISRLRKIISKPKYIERRISELADLAQSLNDFEQFECSDFFKGAIKAEINRKRLKEMKKPLRKLNYYLQKQLTNGTEKVSKESILSLKEEIIK